MSSIIEGYNYDIFISYRQKDNKGDKWVSEFVEALKTELESTFKEEISVYFDINPHDGLLETHDVDASLKDKLKCLVFIPIISRTYCDPKSFAWEHEFKAFVEQASNDQFGLKVKLPNGNVASRVLPVRIYDLDDEDIKLFESIIGGFLRGVEFIYKSAGVNRPLRSIEEKPYDNLNKTIYRDQINKVSNAINEIIRGLKRSQKVQSGETKFIDVKLARFKTGGRIKLPKIKWKILYKTKFVLPTFALYVIGLLILIAFGYFGARWYKSQQKIAWAKHTQIPAIQKLIAENYFTPPVEAFKIASEIEKIIPGDSNLINIWPKISAVFNLETNPPGAYFFWKNYDDPGGEWNYIGTTPSKSVRFPLGFLRIKIEKPGFQNILWAANIWPSDTTDNLFVRLDSLGTLTNNMVRIPSDIAHMLVGGLGQHNGKKIGEFFVDKYEITNKEYKRFVDSGGYSNESYWKHPFYINGKELPWIESVKLFTDKTGKPGPSTWEVGSYIEGTENWPVSGVSWYEAVAYADFVNKQLPTVYHWSILANTYMSTNIIPLSNFNGISLVPVGSLLGISSWGVYDIAGNVREWCINEGKNKDQHYILGGGYNDPTYAFICAGTQLSFDRSPSNGFRCIRLIPGDSDISQLSGRIDLAFRDYRKEKPVDDKTFNIYLSQFAYDKSSLNTKLITLEDNDEFRKEKVTITSAYSKEEFDIYLWLPKFCKPPYQPVIYFPTGDIIGNYIGFTDKMWVQFIDFIYKSGRVLVIPILKGTFDRSDGLKSDLPEESIFYKDHVIMWRKDIGRTIDYLETRNDLASDKIGYFGFSWGGFMGGIIPAIETRFKAIVLHVGGMFMTRALPEVDQLNFLPHVHQPILMLNGKNDMIFPEEISQKPMFDLLGTPASDKKIIIYNSGHLVPRTELIKETVLWYDKYLGSVKK